MKDKHLPINWITIKLENIAQIQSGGTPSRSVSSYWGGNVPWIKISDIKDRYIKEAEEYITEEGVNNSSAKVFKKGTVLFSIFATIGKVGILDIDAATNQAIVGIVPDKDLDKVYLMYVLKNLSHQIAEQGKGIAQKNINISILKKTLIPLPPLAEQKRIADKLDVLFGQLNIVQKAIERIPELIKNFRQQILSSAVTGKLTEEWRKGKNLAGWKTELASVCCDKVQSGGTPKGGNFTESGIPFLKVYNIVHNKIDFEREPQYVSHDMHNSQIKKSITLPGDVIMNIVGPPLNKVAIIPNSYPEWNINQAITLFRPKNYLNNKFLYYFFCEGTPVNGIINQTRGVVGQINISLTQCRNFIIHIPPIEEQKEIVRRIDSIFKKLETIEQQYNALKSKIEKLPQALLNKAFSGELVEHLPSDGDAETLLKEIELLKRTIPKK